MEPLVQEIVTAKHSAGIRAFLRLRLGGECTLWSHPPEFGTGQLPALREWNLNSLECDELIESDLVDCGF